MARKILQKNSDAATGGMSEKDGVRRVNNKKGFRPNTDSAIPPEQQLEEPTPTSAPIKGSDSVVQPTPRPETPQPTPDSSSSSASTPARLAVNPNGTLTVSHIQLREWMDKAAESQTKDYQAKLDQANQEIEKLNKLAEEQRDKLEREKKELSDKIEEERRQRDSLTQLFTDFGFSADGSPLPSVGSDRIRESAYIAPQSLRGGISPKDAAREYEKIYSDNSATPSYRVVTHSGVYFQKDTHLLDRFVLENRDAVRRGMEDIARNAGLLQGRISNSKKDAPTTFANFPVVLREYLSSVVRLEHSARFVLWQFVNRSISAGVPPEQTTLIPRVRHLNAGTTSADWLLTPGTPIVATRQNLAGNNISLPIKEFGMGKNATIEPVAIADIVMHTNLLDLEQLLQERIGYNYHLFEDLLIFELLVSTTAVVYNNGGGVVATAAEVTADGGGQITLNFLGALRAQMSSALVPPLPDGSFIFVGTPYAIAQLETDMQEHNFYADPAVTESMINMFAMKTRNEYAGRLSGYKGRVRGFHVFESTSFSTGLAGTPGVQTETLGGASVTTRSSFAMGADAVGWSTALPMEIRESDDTDFGRMRALIWKSHENATGLDIDPDRTLLPTEVARPVGAEEQLRVFEVRTSDTPV